MGSSPPIFRPASNLLRANSSSTSHLDLYFGGEVFHSPETSDSESDGSGDSHATLESNQVCPRFGHPLQRMFRVGSTDDEDSLFWDPSSSLSSTPGSSAESSVMCDDSDYEGLIDSLLAEPSTVVGNWDDGTFTNACGPPYMGLRNMLIIKRLPANSPEFSLILELNHPELRSDPWNPVPHLLHVAEREDSVYLFMRRLYPYDQPPFRTVANYLDFIRQILEGLTFLHELRIVQISFQDPLHYMVDLSSAPSTCLLPDEFDRTSYPVRYYFTDLSEARKVDLSSSPTETSASLYQRDVRDCGVMIDWLISHAPHIEPKFKSLVKAMTLGGFGVDDSRRLFEALYKSLNSPTLDTLVPVPEETMKRSSSFCALSTRVALSKPTPAMSM